MGQGRFRRISSTRVFANKIGHNYVPLNGDDPSTSGPISVKRGDCIGYHYETLGSSIGVIPHFTKTEPGPFSSEDYSDVSQMDITHSTLEASLVASAGSMRAPITEANNQIPAILAVVSMGDVVFSCDFERDSCGFAIQPDQQFGFSWARSQGFPTTSQTGPSIDHTKKSKDGYFMYTNSAQGMDGSVTSMSSSDINCPSSHCCLQFFYHMFGTAIGSLRVKQKNSGQISTLVTLGGESLGNMWHFYQKTLQISGTFQVLFDGIRGGTNSHIALDDLLVLDGTCPNVEGPERVTGNFSCSFDESMCGFNQMKDSDIFEWSWQTGPTPTTGTGPDGDINGNGAYVYIESTRRNLLDRAVIASPLFNVEQYHGHPQCFNVHFYYHMFGNTVGTLNVYLNYGDAKKLLWEKSGSQQDRWLQASIPDLALTDLPNDAVEFQVSFEGIVGGASYSDISIDQFQILFYQCPGLSIVYFFLFDEINLIAPTFFCYVSFGGFTFTF